MNTSKKGIKKDMDVNGNANTGIDPSWKGVIKWGGLSLLVSGAIAIIFFILVMATGQTLPIPAKEMLEDPLVPSMLFTFCMIGELLLLPSALGLYFALKGVKKTPMLIATAIWIMCVPMFLASRGQIIAISQISSAYTSATDEALRSSYLASAELALETQNLYAMIGLILLSTGSIIMGIVMLKGKEVFGKKIGFVVIGAGIFTILGAASVIVEEVPIIFPVIGVMLSAAWQSYIGYKMYKLGKVAS